MRQTHKFSQLTLALASVLLCGTAQAETVTYPGASLQSITVAGNPYTNALSPAIGSISNNIVTVSSLGMTPAPDAIFGGWHDTLTVSKNTVTVKEAFLPSAIIAGGIGGGETSHNTVNVSSSSKAGIVDTKEVNGGYSYGAAADWNTVSVTNRHVDVVVRGGRSENGNRSNNNSVVLDNSEAPTVYGGYNNNMGSGSTSEAHNNTVTLKNGSRANYVFGGTGEFTNGNTVNIQDSTVTGMVAASQNGSGGINNTVSISGKSVLDGALIVGGDNQKTGNTLQMHTSGIRARDIFNFENLHFYLPNSIANGDVVLALDNQAFGVATDITGANIGVAVTGGKAALQPGNRITLIHADVGLTADAKPVNNTRGMKGIQGVSLRYGFDLSTDPNNLYATVSKVETNPQTKSLSEGRLGGLAFVNQGADLLSNAGIAYALEAAQTERHLFSVFSGGDLRYKSGSHVDVKGVNLLAGASAKLPNSSGQLMLTGFFEAGWGNYDSFNNFADAADVKGSGDNRYYGAGILARQDFSNKFYTEGSIRAGKLENDYNATLSGTAAHYKINKAYYGAHLGAGYLMPLGTGELDMYGKYLWTRQNGGKHTIAGDVFTFDDINSQRSKLGARYSHPLSESTTLKLGAAWEYEFDGKANASVHGLPIAAPSLKGHTGVLDLGIKISPASNKRLSFEAGIQGYAGKRQGVTGNVAVKYVF